MGCGRECECPSYRDHLLTVSVAAAALPSRRGDVAQTERKERVLRKDLDSYQRLRRDGLQPARVDGSHRLEAKADSVSEVESGVLVSDRG